MSYILVTGGTGFIGSQLVELLLKNKNDVVLLKRSFSNTWRIDHLLNKYDESLFLENVDHMELEEIFQKYDIEGVFHLATYYNKKPDFDEIKPMTESNILFPVELLNLSVKYSVKYFINTGTFMEYTLNDEQLVSSYKVNPQNYYSATKIAFEDILKYFGNMFNIKVATIKIYSPYGNKDDENKIIPYLIISSIENKVISINNPENRLNIVHIEDILDAFLGVKENILSFKGYETFDIANDVTYTITDILQIIKKNVYSEDIQLIKGRKIGEIPNLDNNKKISWKAKVDIEAGIKKTVEYYKNKYGGV